jgi:glycosyltransferase involved in cell wall biosynthesis
MISIFLATYNGEKYLDQQLLSLYNQTYQDFIIYAIDDCSTDNTISILERWKAIIPDKLIISQRETNSGKPQIPFLELAIKNKATDYYMFCDQDDVWFPDKIEITLSAMLEYEKRYTSSTPILLGTELVITDQNLVPYKRQKRQLNYVKYAKPNKLICYNIFTGCTLIYNRALSKHILEIPEKSILHDWWLAFIASSLGQTGIIPHRTMYYRQHGNNSVGVEVNRSINYYMKRFMKIWNNDYYHLAGLYLQYFSQSTPKQNLVMIGTYADIPNRSFVYKIISFIKFQYWAPGVLRKIFQVLR